MELFQTEGSPPHSLSHVWNVSGKVSREISKSVWFILEVFVCWEGVSLLGIAMWTGMLDSWGGAEVLGLLGHLIICLLWIQTPNIHISTLLGWSGLRWCWQICTWVICSLASRICKVCPVFHILTSSQRSCWCQGRRIVITCGSCCYLLCICKIIFDLSHRRVPSQVTHMGKSVMKIIQQWNYGILQDYESSNWFWQGNSYFFEKSVKRRRRTPPRPPPTNYQRKVSSQG